jgi:hypothetical protein
MENAPQNASGHVKSPSLTVGIKCIGMSTVLSLLPKRLLTLSLPFIFTIIFKHD